jgi:hypothetical protein
LGAQQFKVITDDKPLQAMFNKTAGDLPPRIEKFIMDIQEYEYVVEYHPGKTNIADYLSRHPRTYAISSSVQAADEFARTVVRAERVIIIIIYKYFKTVALQNTYGYDLFFKRSFETAI